MEVACCDNLDECGWIRKNNPMEFDARPPWPDEELPIPIDWDEDEGDDEKSLEICDLEP